MKKITIGGIALVIGASALIACIQKPAYISPEGYDFTKPVKYDVPAELNEISGIAFNKGNTDKVYAESDETGKVYYFKLGDKKVNATSFKDNGDFEDIAISDNQVIMLQSKGVLFSIPLTEIGKPQTEQAQRSKNLLPEGEYEGLYANENGEVYALCKHCTTDKTSKENSGYIFQLGADGSLNPSGNFKINVRRIEDILEVDKINFHPSALARSPLSNDWYILSSVNKILVVTDANWKVRRAYKLDPNLFSQPEGMTFDNQNNLYISNEAHTPVSGNILKFTYKNQK
jgi:hypothetical protein